MEILKLLFHTRGGSIKQISTALKVKHVQTVYRSIKELRDANLLKGYKVYEEANNMLFLYLSEEGLEFMYRFYDVLPRYRGEGYNNDHGEFPYKVYAPPTRQMNHHMLLVDFLIICKDIKEEYQSTLLTLTNEESPETLLAKKGDVADEIFDYRDNRYSSKTFKETVIEEGKKPYIKTQKFKPDAEVKIHNRIYLVEFDRGTERKGALREKFEGYKKYLQHLEKENHLLPQAILFVYEERTARHGIDRRWETINNTFFDVLQPYTDRINLIFTKIDNVRDVLIREIQAEEIHKEACLNIQKRFISNYPYYKGINMGVVTKKHGYQYGKAYITISNTEQGDTLFVYLPATGYETRNWVLSRKFPDFVRSMRHTGVYKKVTNVIPVFIFDGTPCKPPDEFVSKHESFFEQTLYFNSRDEEGSWYSYEWEKLEGNPLVKK